MTKKAVIPKNPITIGERIGKLVVGQLVSLSDPRIIEYRTPPSYLKHGSMRECKCDCGSICFVSNYILQRRQMKSCGCIRLGMLRKKFTVLGNKDKLEAAMEKKRKLFIDYKIARIKGDQALENKLYGEIQAVNKEIQSMTVPVGK